MPAVAMTDHGNIFGAVIVRQRRQRSGREADPRLRALHLQEGRPSRLAGRRQLQPPHRAGRERPGLSQPGEDCFRSVAARLLLQAAHQQEISRRAFAGTDRSLGMPEGRSRRATDGREVRRCASRRPPAYNDIFGKGNFYLEIQDQGLPEEKRIQSEPAEAGAGARPAAGGDQRQPLSLRRRLARAGRDGLHPDRQVDQRHQSPEVHRQSVLREESGRDGESLLRLRARAGAHDGDCRALQRSPGESPRSVSAVRSSRRLLAAGLLRARDARRLCEAPEDAARAANHGPAEALARGLRKRALARNRDHPPDAVPRILPHRVGLHPLRQGAATFRSVRAADRRPDRLSLTRWPSPTSIRCRTSCCSSAS